VYETYRAKLSLLDLPYSRPTAPSVTLSIHLDQRSTVRSLSGRYAALTLDNGIVGLVIVFTPSWIIATFAHFCNGLYASNFVS
jgi:hypothetical protein